MNTSNANSANNTQSPKRTINSVQLDKAMQANTRAWSTLRMIADDEMAIVDRCKEESHLALVLAADDLTTTGDFLTDLVGCEFKSWDEVKAEKTAKTEGTANTETGEGDSGWLPRFFSVPQAFEEFPTDSVMNIAAMASVAASAKDADKWGVALAGHLAELAAKICGRAGAEGIACKFTDAGAMASNLVALDSRSNLCQAAVDSIHDNLIRTLQDAMGEAREY